MKRSFFLLGLLCSFQLFSQTDAETIKKIFNSSLSNGQSYQWLDYLSNQIGSRLSGSLGAERAVQYTKDELDKLGLDRVWLQPVMVPKWVRGNPEFAYIETAPGKTTSVNICALGGSIATSKLGLNAEVIEVQGLEELKENAGNIIGMMLKTPQTPGGLTGPGKLVRKILVAEDAYAPDFDACKEFYVSILMDRERKQNVIIHSTEGGVEIEKVAEETPEKILRAIIDPLVETAA